MIEESLKAEDRALYAAHGEEGMFGQFGGLFRGKLAFANIASAAAQIAMFFGALYAARQFLAADDVAALLRWGALVAMLFAAMSVIKLMHWSQMQANRVIREIKRVELLLARAK
jgi:hypothetical protein